MLVVKATETHSELKTRAQSVVRIQTGAGRQAAKCFRNQHCSRDQRRFVSFFPCFLISQPIPAIFFPFDQELPWFHQGFPSPLAHHVLSWPSTTPHSPPSYHLTIFVRMSEFMFPREKTWWLSLSFLLSKAVGAAPPEGLLPFSGIPFLSRSLVRHGSDMRWGLLLLKWP